MRAFLNSVNRSRKTYPKQGWYLSWIGVLDWIKGKTQGHKMAQWIKVPVAKSDDPGTHTVEEENCVLQIVPWPPHICYRMHMDGSVHTPTHTHYNFFLKKKQIEYKHSSLWFLSTSLQVQYDLECLCHCDFPAMVDNILKLWLKTNLSFLKLFLLQQQDK